MLSEIILIAAVLFAPMQGIHDADNVEKLQAEVIRQGVIIDKQAMVIKDLHEKLAIAEEYYREEVENTEIVVAGYERKIKQMRRSSRFEKAICWTKVGLAAGVGYVAGDD